MSDKKSDFESFQPVVGRIKSKRWVTDATNTYDGDEWGDRYNDYSGDEDEGIPPVPAVPEIPDLASLSHDTTSESISKSTSAAPVPLVLGTKAEAVQSHLANASTAAHKRGAGADTDDETGIESNVKTSIDNTEEVIGGHVGGDVGNTVSSQEHHDKHDTNGPSYSQETSQEPETVTTRYGTEMPALNTSKAAPNSGAPVSAGLDSAYPEDIYGYYQDEGDTGSDMKTVEPVSKPKPERETHSTAGSDDSPNVASESDSDHEQEQPVKAVKGGRWKPLEDETSVAKESFQKGKGEGKDAENVSANTAHTTTNSLSVDTDAKAPANSGLDEYGNGQETEPETASGTPVTLLTREILGNFNVNEPPSTSGLKRDESSGNLDPEIAALYANSSKFLNRPLSQYDYNSLATEPLSPKKSQEDEFEGNSKSIPEEEEYEEAEAEEDEPTETVSHSQPSANVPENVSLPQVPPRDEPSHSLPVVPPVVTPRDVEESAAIDPSTSTAVDHPLDPSVVDSNIGETLSPIPSSKPSSEQFRDFDSDFSSQVPPPTQPRNRSLDTYDTSIESDKILAKTTTGNTSNDGDRSSSIDPTEVRSIATAHSTGSVVRLDSDDTNTRETKFASGKTQQTSSSSVTARNTRATSGSISQRLNRPPAFDFMGILSKPRPEERVAAFHLAIEKELAYNPGLDAWLDYAKQSAPKGVYTSGKPPPPTQVEARLAVPSRTVSTTLIKPAKHISKEAFGKAGEKGSKTAKALFAKGRKLMKTQPS